MGKWSCSTVNSVKKPPKAVFWGILAISVACLVFSISAEILANLTPCKLCLAQRYTYLGLACLSAFGLARPHNRLVFLGVIIGLIIGLFFASYQSLAHFDLINAKCSNPSTIGDLGSFKRDLSSSPNCADSSVTLLGIPVALFNTFVYAGLIGYCYIQKRKF